MSIKTDYTLEELKKSTWATIGGRIEDYVELHKEKSLKEVIENIEKIYRENADEVFKGYLIFVNFGIDVYYEGFPEENYIQSNQDKP